MTRGPSTPFARVRPAALYADGFLGPFGGAMTASALPEVGADFDVPAGAAAATLTGYLLPFALFMLVSGTLGERWGARRTVRVAAVGCVAWGCLGGLAFLVALRLGEEFGLGAGRC
ncbi:hypothetical protein [Saccharothrix sp. HUAS TT1]|uniref:hypothetical protein n=1 Tax=unclassified Saccharothrix TaxID=2593673 RepID=UPI00345B8EC5